jgi:pimeloyl-ACP methyl ester carboxylesterase
MSYADVNGLSLYYEEHGSGEPLVLLHGGIGSGEMFVAIIPDLAAGRRVITVDLQGHGHTADIDRPFSPEDMADDVAALVSHLGLAQTDVMGYSLGGAVALRIAIQHPELVRRLVLVSIPCRRDGNHPEVITAMDQMTPEIAEMMKQSPPYTLYSSIAPRPEDWPVLIAKTSDLLKVDYDWTAETAQLTAPTMFVFADADSVRPAHIVEFFGLLGGGLRDAGWDGSARPTARLAVLPGTTHYDVFMSPLLAAAVIPFLDAPALGPG